ncbi:hypothetical protein BDV93DRAFT_570893 [Ceratobasidium sp. AG-I]|nr:hypothetical protein BDV93DRAFT_570893 [Ceratobasidium sp. AG-I]
MCITTEMDQQLCVMLKTLQKYWYFIVTVARLAFETSMVIFHLIGFINRMSLDTRSPDELQKYITLDSLKLAYGVTCLRVVSVFWLDNVQLYVYKHDTWLVLSTASLGRGVGYTGNRKDVYLIFKPGLRIICYEALDPAFKSPIQDFPYTLTELSLTLAIFNALWIRFTAKFGLRGIRSNNPWMVNAQDLVSGTKYLSRKATWRGDSRQKRLSSKAHVRLFARSLSIVGKYIVKPVVKFVAGALFRRVIPVETRVYALFQNAFALAAIILLLMRVVILLTQLQNEDFQTRTVVQPCTETYTGDNGIAVLISHSEERGLNATQTRESEELKYLVEITINDVRNSSARAGGSSSRDPSYGIRYSIALRNASGDPSNEFDLPKLWFGMYSIVEHSAMIPHLVPALQPLLGMYTFNELHYAERRFITSSGIRDAITGSKPTYGKVVKMYPWIIAYGAVLWPKYVDTTTDLTQAALEHVSNQSLCHVVEDYRSSSPLDLLGSIGGLLALLQGIHIFFFGRPLFWGLFGAKLISPFGIFGRMATESFRQRLAEHYGAFGVEATTIANDADVEAGAAIQGAVRAQDTIDMTQFLLDYVLDMGPAINQHSRRESPDPELPRSSLEMDELSEHQSARNRRTSNDSE